MNATSDRVGQPLTEILGMGLPEPATPAGYAALIEEYSLQIPVPARLAAVGTRRNPKSSGQWTLVTGRQAIPRSLGQHLEFALKHEGVDLSVLSALFRQAPQAEIEAVVRATPYGAYSRRIWFLYEWMTNRTLDVPALGKIRAVPVLNRAQQFGLDGGNRSSRHSIIDNLPGTREFCPLVRRTSKLNDFETRGFDRLARDVVGRTHSDVIARAAAFMLLSDSRSSFYIEGERPSAQRAARWAQTIGQAGARPLTVEELEQLQRLVIADARFVRLGLRTEGGFVGMHDRRTGEPLPDHITARADDLGDLMRGLIAYSERAKTNKVDPVTTAAALAFGFAYIHPFEDGNGRIHRWLFHHVLSSAGYNPPGLVFPISATIYSRIDAYKGVLESYSRPLLAFIDWRPTDRGNVEVLNDTADYYRYFDATSHAEFLYECIQRTVEHDLPDEVAYLEAYDAFARRVQEIVDMPQSRLDLLHRFLRQNGGSLSQRARTQEFNLLTPGEVDLIEAIYQECFARVRRHGELDEDDLPST